MSQIGRPVDEPQMIDVDLVLERQGDVCALVPAVQEIARMQLERLPALRDELLSERVAVC